LRNGHCWQSRGGEVFFRFNQRLILEVLPSTQNWDSLEDSCTNKGVAMRTAKVNGCERSRSARFVAELSAMVFLGALTANTAVASGQEGDESYRPRDGKEQCEEDKVGSRFYGTVQKIPAGRCGAWIVNGRQILVARDTKIVEGYGSAVVGAYVEVEGYNTGKSFNACKVEVKRAKR
jgi:hypothetical protein